MFENMVWFIGGIFFGYSISPFFDALGAVLRETWKKYKEPK